MKIALAIDNLESDILEDYRKIVHKYDDYVDAVKVGLETYMLHGPKALFAISKNKTFLDLKFHDIPNTVGKAVEKADGYFIKWATVHGANDKQTLRKAVEMSGNVKLLAVTRLTSSNPDGWFGHTKDIVAKCVDCGINGFVCPVAFIEKIKSEHPNAFVCCPGIRFENSDKNDQVWTATPEDAWELGADMIVLGRAVFQSEDPLAALESVQKYRE